MSPAKIILLHSFWNTCDLHSMLSLNTSQHRVYQTCLYAQIHLYSCLWITISIKYNDHLLQVQRRNDNIVRVEFTAELVDIMSTAVLNSVARPYYLLMWMCKDGSQSFSLIRRDGECQIYASNMLEPPGVCGGGAHGSATQDCRQLTGFRSVTHQVSILVTNTVPTSLWSNIKFTIARRVRSKKKCINITYTFD